MARKYVRDKIGRFAPKGGGSKGKGGKMGKSSKNVKARAAYKKASGKLRSMKKISGGAKDAKDRKFWNKSLGGAKSGMTRVTNRLTNKRAAKSGLKETFSSQLSLQIFEHLPAIIKNNNFHLLVHDPYNGISVMLHPARYVAI